MSPKTLALALAGMLCLTGSAHAADGNAEAGKTVFQKCAPCHSTQAGQNKIGPSLAGVVGREAGSEPGYSYSEAMKNVHHKWTPEELRAYLEDPRKVVPGTKMIFPGLKSDKDRDNIIAYLESLKSGEGAGSAQK